MKYENFKKIYIAATALGEFAADIDDGCRHDCALQCVGTILSAVASEELTVDPEDQDDADDWRPDDYPQKNKEAENPPNEPNESNESNESVREALRERMTVCIRDAGCVDAEGALAHLTHAGFTSRELAFVLGASENSIYNLRKGRAPSIRAKFAEIFLPSREEA